MFGARFDARNLHETLANMDIDLYQTCPCHAEKKIKFCCGKEVIGDLNEILRLNRARQSVAALEQLERAGTRLGERDCLQTLQTHILINLKRYDDARRCNERFLARNPNQPIGHQHRALLFAADGDADAAVDALQDSLDVLSGNQVPLSMANAFRIIGLLLLSLGRMFSARAHFRMAQLLRPEDESISEMLLESFQVAGQPLVLKHDLTLLELTRLLEGQPPLAPALHAARMGRWRAARRFLQQTAQGQPPLLQAVAILSSWLGHPDQSADDWQCLAQCAGIGFDQAVDAQAVALLTRQQPLTPMLDVVRLTYAINEIDRLMEVCAASKRLLQGVQAIDSPDDDRPPAKAGYLLLDRPQLQTAKSIDVASIPNIWAQIEVFGKQTDRPARLEAMAVRDEHFASAKAALSELIGQWLDGDPTEEVVGQVPQVEHVFATGWQLPKDMTVEQHKELIRLRREQDLLQRWTEVPFAALQGKTPRQAAEEPSLRIPLAALVSLLEQAHYQQRLDESLITRLRQQLQLPAPGTIDPRQARTEFLWPGEIGRLEFNLLSDEQLLGLYLRTTVTGNLHSLQLIAGELLNRPQLDQQVHLESVYAILARLTEDDEHAVRLIHEARQHAVAHQRMHGLLLVKELEIRLERGITDQCSELLRAIQGRLDSEPNIEAYLISVLQRFGIIGPHGEIRIPEELSGEARGEPSAALEEASALWTPESAVQPASVPAGEGKSKLWLPPQ